MRSAHLFFMLLVVGFGTLLAGADTQAQSGDWIRSGWDSIHPRTLLIPTQIEPTRQRLNDPFFKEIYASLWQSAVGGSSADPGDLPSALTAKNVAFVLLLNKKVEAGVVEELTEAERSTLREKLLLIFGRIQSDVGTALDYTDWQWRSKELIALLCAYDLALGSGMSTSELADGEARLQEFAANLHRESTRSALGISFFSSIKNNHALMTAAAIGMAAVVLRDAGNPDPNTQPSTWINTALWNIDNLLWTDPERRLSEPRIIAGYAEGPHYLRYASLNLLPFFHALGNILPNENIQVSFNESPRVIGNPFFDSNYDLLWEWIARIRTPEGLMPTIEDTFRDQGFPELALTGKRKFLFPITSTRTNINAQLQSTVDMRGDFIAAGIIPFEVESRSPFQGLVESGNLVFRSSWNPDAFYMHVCGEHGIPRESGGGHNQADASSFMVMVGQEMMALDPGYVQYDLRDSVGRATDHNMILVDGRGPEIGTPGAANDADAWVADTFSLPGLQFGSVATEYEGTSITRHILFLRNYYAAIADFVTSDNEHTYTWQLHGNGLEDGDATTGVFKPKYAEREGTWDHNGAALSTHVVSRGEDGTYGTATNVHESGYSTFGLHSTMTVEDRGIETEFLAGLAPENVSNALDFESHGREGQTTLISRIHDHDIISISRDTTYREVKSFDIALPESIFTDAQLIALDPAAFSDAPPAFFFMKEGTHLAYGNRPFLESTQRTDLAVVRLGEGEYAGYCRDSGMIFIIMDEGITDVIGDGVRSWMMLWATGRVAIDLSGGGYFRMTTTSAAPETPNHDDDRLTTTLRGTHHSGNVVSFTITGNSSPNGTIRIHDLTGRFLRSLQVNGLNRVDADLSALPSGTYLSTLLDENGLPLAGTKLTITH